MMASTDTTTLKPDYIGGLLPALLIAVLAAAAVASIFLNIAFLVCGLIVSLVAITVFQFELFLYLQIFLLPWYPLLDAKLPLRDVSMVLRFVLLAGVLVQRIQRGKPLAELFVGDAIRKAILAFAAVATLSLLVSGLGPNADAVRSLARLFSYLALFFAVAGWLENKKQLERIIKLILCSGILVALFGFIQYWVKGYSDLYFYLYPLQEEGLEEWNGRITSFLFHFNSLAGYLNLILPVSLGCMVLAKERWTRQLALICHGTALAALYFTGSRGGLIAYAVMLLASMYFLKPRWFALSRILRAVGLAVAIVVLLELPSHFEAESESRLQQIDEFTSISRMALWGAAGAMFFQHPVLGVGYGNYRSLYSDYIPGAAPNQLDAHNLYLQYLGETGIIGFAAFCVLVVLLARIAVKLAGNPDWLQKIVGIAMGGALAATLAHGMVDYLFNVSPQFGALFWLVMALGVIAFKEERLLNPR